jgi:hypothetical protein
MHNTKYVKSLCLAIWNIYVKKQQKSTRLTYVTHCHIDNNGAVKLNIEHLKVGL